MDTSETYIKMCEKAEEIQELFVVRQGSWLYFKKEFNTDDIDQPPNPLSIGQIIYFNKDISCYTILDGYDDSAYFNREDFIWLPHQDQLQEMVGFVFNSYDAHIPNLESLNWFANWGYGSSVFIKQPRELFASMEQLWLAFVMKEKYGKSWNGKGWT